MDVINWLGAYFVRNEVYEKAMKYFERAAQIEPKEVKWRLLVASCYRRIGAFPKAKQMYEEIHRAHPNNIECPRYLLHLCKEMGLTEEAVVYHKVCFVKTTCCQKDWRQRGQTKRIGKKKKQKLACFLYSINHNNRTLV